MRYRRSKVAGASYFFTVVTFDRQPILTRGGHPDLIRAILSEIRKRRPFRIDAFVLLPEHLHCIWTLPPGDSDFATRWSLVKSHFTRRCSARDMARGDSRKAKRERSVWQRRYWEHLLRDETDFERHCDYIHYNPVKHGLADSAGEWPYSSFARYVREGRYPVDWGAAPVSFEPGIGRE